MCMEPFQKVLGSGLKSELKSEVSQTKLDL